MPLWQSWKESLLFLLPHTFYRDWYLLSGRLYSVWWQKGYWFISGVVIISILLLEGILMNVAGWLFISVWGFGVFCWVLSIFTLYYALYEVLEGQRLLSSFQWFLVITISLCMRGFLALSGALLDPQDGIIHELSSRAGIIFGTCASPFGITDVYSLTGKYILLPHAGRFETDDAVFFVFFMLLLIGYGAPMRTFCYCIWRSANMTIKCYPFALIAFFIGTMGLALVDHGISWLLWLGTSLVHHGLMDGKIPWLIFTMIRSFILIPWGLLLLPCMLAFIGLFYKKIASRYA